MLSQGHARADVLLTGPFRSGTTLACGLLNQVPMTIALDEPMPSAALLALEPDSACERVDAFATEQRCLLRDHGVALSKHAGTSMTTNHFADRRVDGRRPSIERHGHVVMQPPRSDDFVLVIKHPAAFTALLPSLRQCFRCVAIVRNPLAIVASWESVQLSAADGRSPLAERLDPNLAAALRREPDRDVRVLTLLHWFFDQYRQWLDDDQVVSYESIVASGGRTLQAVTAAAAALAVPVINRNCNTVYDGGYLRRMRAKLLRHGDAAWWHYYSPADLERITDALSPAPPPRP